MPTAEPIDYPAELDRLASLAMAPTNPGDVLTAHDATTLREAARIIRNLSAVIATNKIYAPPRPKIAVYLTRSPTRDEEDRWYAEVEDDDGAYVASKTADGEVFYQPTDFPTMESATEDAKRWCRENGVVLPCLPRECP